MHTIKIALRLTALLILMSSLSQQSSFAQQNDNNKFSDTIIANTLKSIAKAYVSTANLDNLIKKLTSSINNMSEETFRKKYLTIYPIIRQSPGLASMYPESLSKKRAKAIIYGIDKDKIYKTIDALSNKAIAEKCVSYINKRSAKTKSSSDKLNGLWNNTLSWLGINN